MGLGTAMPMTVRNSTLLIALDGVVLDTETTGLDPATARIVEIGAIKLDNGRTQPAETLHALVRPGVPIPAAATAIHGIGDAKVLLRRCFRKSGRSFASASAQRLSSATISVSIWPCCAVNASAQSCRSKCRECWTPGRLAQVVEPHLAGYTLESLSAWLGIEPARRHSALGDAETTARIFSALVPRLRDGGIRTLGEAMRACRSLTGVLEGQHRAGWEDTAQPLKPLGGFAGIDRIDSYPYKRRRT